VATAGCWHQILGAAAASDGAVLHGAGKGLLAIQLMQLLWWLNCAAAVTVAFNLLPVLLLALGLLPTECGGMAVNTLLVYWLLLHTLWSSLTSHIPVVGQMQIRMVLLACCATSQTALKNFTAAGAGGFGHT